jgi:hypothetical protein
VWSGPMTGGAAAGSFVYGAPAALEAWCQTHPADPAHPRLIHGLVHMTCWQCVGRPRDRVVRRARRCRHRSRRPASAQRRPQCSRSMRLAALTPAYGPRSACRSAGGCRSWRDHQLQRRASDRDDSSNSPTGRLAVSQVTGSVTRMGEKVRTLSSCRLRRSRPVYAAQRRFRSPEVVPTSQHTNLPPLVEGPAVRLASRHAKVRRDGYRKRQKY